MCKRCLWLDESKPDYVDYHDTQWGVPLFDDHKLFEFLTLESAQAGLSWYTILKKRKNYQSAFMDFDPAKVALFDDVKEHALLNNPGIIRNKLKISAAINNAKQFLKIQQQYGSFAAFQWQFVNDKPMVNSIRSEKDYVSTSKESEQFSKALKQHGFKFLGPTTVYAHMQASGMVNDHLNLCFRKEEIISQYKAHF